MKRPHSLFLLLSVAISVFSCSTNPSPTTPQKAAYSNWQKSYADSQSADEKLNFVNQRFVSEGSHRALLEEYESTVSAVEESWLNTVVAAEQVAMFGGPNSKAPLSNSLARYQQIALKCQYLGERQQRPTLILKAQEMQSNIADICKAAGGQKSGIPVCVGSNAKQPQRQPH